MSDLRELYQDLILDHGRSPRNFRADEAANHKAEGFNPLCGDKIALYVRTGADGRIESATFQGKGCAISTASASLMTQALKGQTVAEARALFDRFHDLITGADGNGRNGADLGKLEVFAGVREFPNRVKCASLAWHTLKAALDEAGAPVSTE
jgi:nitrogen fixation NifU-like protein